MVEIVAFGYQYTFRSFDATVEFAVRDDKFRCRRARCLKGLVAPPTLFDSAVVLAQDEAVTVLVQFVVDFLIIVRALIIHTSLCSRHESHIQRW